MAEVTVYESKQDQETLERGLRILARMIARKYARDRARPSANGHGDPGDIPEDPGGSLARPPGVIKKEESHDASAE